MYWAAEPIFPPCHAKSVGRTMWCPGGEEYYNTRRDNPGFKLTPGKHFKVVEDKSDCITFPNIPVLSTFRHKWVLVRNPWPVVPVFQRAKPPRAGMSAEEKAHICS